MSLITINANFEELEFAFRNLTPSQRRLLSSRYDAAFIRNFFLDLRTVISSLILNSVKSKIATEFNNGYNGKHSTTLYDSVYIVWQGNDVIVKSKADYMKYLNAGWEPFDMKESLSKTGGPIPIHLPGGRVIFRTVSDGESRTVKNLNTYLKTKQGTVRRSYSTKNWINPGYQGKHIFERVATELKPVIESLVKDEIQQLLDNALIGSYSVSNEGYRYTYRDNSGRFVSLGDSAI